MNPVLADIRLFIYRQLIETSCAPSFAETARALSRPAGDVEAAYLALADARAIVLRPGTSTIWMAMPFANEQTAFTVVSRGRAYYATCAYDALGVAAVLGADSRIFTTCADCGGALERKIARGTLTERRGLVHFALPARRWWENIGFT